MAGSYTTDKIRNVVLLGHSGCGKTSLAEAMLFNTGAINRLGRVELGHHAVDRFVHRSASSSTLAWGSSARTSKIVPPGNWSRTRTLFSGASLGLPTLVVMEGGYAVEALGANLAAFLSGF